MSLLTNLTNPLAPYKYLIIAILLIFYTGGSIYLGYRYEDNVLIAFTAKVKEAGDAQTAAAAAKDKQNQEDANEAQTNATQAINSIADYYNQHPVTVVTRLPNGTSSCTVSGATNSPGSTNEAGATGNAPTQPAVQYVSPYNPEQVEEMASQLNQLEKLLINDGVQVQQGN